MTTMGSLRKEGELEDILLCSLCEELLEDAKILECRHRFCKRCLTGVIDDVAADATTLCCPHCQHEQNLPGDRIEGILDDLCLDEILRNKKIERDLKNSKKEQVCSACEKLMTAVAICSHCGGFLCDACFSAHGTFRIFKSHGDIVTLDDIETGRETFDGHNISSYAPKPKCSLHEDMILHIHCKTCDVLICSLCEPVYHQSHEIEVIDAAGKRANTRILELLEGSKRKENILQERAAYITGLRKKYETVIKEITEQAENRANNLGESIKKQKSKDLQDLENKRRMIEERAEEKLDEVNRGRKFIIDETILMNAFLHQFCRDAGKETQETLREVRDYQAIAKLVIDDGNNWSLLRAVSEIEESLKLGDELEKDSVIRSWDRATPSMSDLSSSTLEDLSWSMHAGRSISDQLITKSQHFISQIFDISGAEEDNILLVATVGGSLSGGIKAQLFLSGVNCDRMKRVSLSTIEDVPGIERVLLAGRDEGHSYIVCVKSDSSSLYRNAVLIDDLKLPSSVLCCVLLPSGGGLLVGVENSITLYRCNLEAAQVSTVTIDDNNLQPPVSLAVAADGTIILCDGKSKALAVSHHGKVTSRFQTRLRTDQPLRVSTDRKGFIYILWMRRQMFTSVVMQYSPKGTLISEIPVSGLSTNMTTMVIGGRDVVVLAGSVGMIKFYEKTSFGEMLGQYVMHRDDPSGYKPLSVWLEEWQEAATVQSDTQEDTDEIDDDSESMDKECLLTTDIEVKIRQSHEDPDLVNRTGVIREIHGPVCSVVLDGDEVLAVDSIHLEPIKPATCSRGDKIKIISGEYKGNTGLLHSVEDGRGVVSLDSAPSDSKILAMDLLAIPYYKSFDHCEGPVRHAKEDSLSDQSTQSAVAATGHKVETEINGASLNGGLSSGVSGNSFSQKTENTGSTQILKDGGIIQHAKKSYPTVFQAPSAYDTEVRNGATQQVNTRHQVISAMEQYKHKSIEEIRLDDYHVKKNSPSFKFNFSIRSNPGADGRGVKKVTKKGPSGLFGSSATESSSFGAPPKFLACSTTSTGFGFKYTPTFPFEEPAKPSQAPGLTISSGFKTLSGLPSMLSACSTNSTGFGFKYTPNFSFEEPAKPSRIPGLTLSSGFKTPSGLPSASSACSTTPTGFGFKYTPTFSFEEPVKPSQAPGSSTSSGSKTLLQFPSTSSTCSTTSTGFGFKYTPTFSFEEPAKPSQAPGLTISSGFKTPSGLPSASSACSTTSTGFGFKYTPTFSFEEPAKPSQAPGSPTSSSSKTLLQFPSTSSTCSTTSTGFGIKPTSASFSGEPAEPSKAPGSTISSGFKTPSGLLSTSSACSTTSTGFGFFKYTPTFSFEEPAKPSQAPRSSTSSGSKTLLQFPSTSSSCSTTSTGFGFKYTPAFSFEEPAKPSQAPGSSTSSGSKTLLQFPSISSTCSTTSTGFGFKYTPTFSFEEPAKPSQAPGPSTSSGSKTLLQFTSTLPTCITTSTGFGFNYTPTFSLGQSAKPSQAPGSTISSGLKTPSGLPLTLSACSTPSTQFGSKLTSAFSLGEPAEPSQVPGSAPSSGSKMPFSTAGFGFRTSQPTSSGVGITSAITCASATATFCFQSPSSKTNFGEDDVPDSSVGSSAGSTTPVSQKGSQLSPYGQKKFTFGGNMPTFSFGTLDQSGPTSFSFSAECPRGSSAASVMNESTDLVGCDSPKSPASERRGDGEESTPSFAVNAQFSFHLDVDEVVSSPPQTTDEPTSQSPGLERSGEYYQSDDRDELHFEPVVTLPEVVELETGEEGEEVRFTNRAKLYRWDYQGKQWKERGVGDIKVLYHPETRKCRIVMRREQVLKVCANHFITRHMDLQPKSGSYRSWVWHAMDASDGVVLGEQLAVRFETDDAANEFKEVVETAKEDHLEDEN